MLQSLKINSQVGVSTSHLALFRIVFFSWYLIRVLQTLKTNYYDLLYRNPYNPIPLFESLHIGRMDGQTYIYLSIALIISLILAIEGRFSRLAFPVVAICSFLLIGTSLGYYKAPNNPYVPHSQNVLMFFLILFSLTPRLFHKSALQLTRDLFDKFKKKSRSEEVVSVFHLFPFKLVLCASYFGAAFVRLKTNGLGWLDGYTLQAYLYERSLLLDIPIAHYLAQKHEVCIALSILLNIFELTFFITCINSFLFVVGSIVAISLHFLIYYIMGINFLNWHLLNYSVMLPELIIFISMTAKSRFINTKLTD